MIYLIRILSIFALAYSLGLFATFNLKWPKRLDEFERFGLVSMILLAIFISLFIPIK